MKIVSVDTLYQLQSVQHFLGRLVDDLADKRSIIVLLPNRINPIELMDVLQAELWRRDFVLEKVSLANQSNSQNSTLVTMLSSELEIEWPYADTPHTIMNLMKVENLPEVILIEGIEQLPYEERGNWSSFLVQWAEHCQHRTNQGLPITAICIVAPAVAILDHVPENKIYLEVHWWWGFPSSLEMRFLCRLTTSTDGWDTMTQWREYVVPALVGNDTSLASDFMELDILGDIQAISNHLQTVAEQREWNVENLRTWGLEEDFSFPNTGYSLAPPRSLRMLWAHGVVGWTLEYGLELHVAVLAVLGKKEELSHRLWRGQAELVLPLIDRTRLEICRHFTSFYGSDWPVREYKPESFQEEKSVRENPLACQLGHLAFLLKNASFISSEEPCASVISFCRWIRNKIAHSSPITFRDFEGFLHEVRKIQ